MIWDTLLQIRETLMSTPASRSIIVKLGDSESGLPSGISIDETLEDADIYIVLDGNPMTTPPQAMTIQAPAAFSLSINRNHALRLSTTELTELETYLPYALLPCFANF